MNSMTNRASTCSYRTTFRKCFISQDHCCKYHQTHEHTSVVSRDSALTAGETVYFELASQLSNNHKCLKCLGASISTSSKVGLTVGLTFRCLCVASTRAPAISSDLSFFMVDVNFKLVILECGFAGTKPTYQSKHVGYEEPPPLAFDFIDKKNQRTNYEKYWAKTSCCKLCE